MAQLRDKVTSELLASGTPEEVVLAAARIDLNEVIFDGVGEGFDPEAVKQAYEDRVSWLAANSADTDLDQSARDLADAAHQDALDVDARAAELVPEATELLQQARSRVEPD